MIFNNHSFNITSSLSNILPENTIGEKIKKLRSSLGLTQLQFGQPLNKALTTIANWENGYRNPSKYILTRIVSIYKLDTHYFEI